MKPSRALVSLVVMATLVGTSCTDDPPTAPLDTESAPAWTPPADVNFAYVPGADTENCIEDVVEFYDGTNSVPLNCTAEDVRIASVELPDTPIPLECTLGEPVIIPTLIAELVAGASERYDIGGWIARDGGDARGGSCTRFFLDGDDFGTGGISPLAPNCGTDNHDPNGGPWYNAECAEDSGDLCGDLVQNESNFVTLTNVEVLCQDPDDDGFLEVTSCLSWDNGKSAGTNNKPSCEVLDDARPNNKSKCNCEELDIPIVVRESALLEVVKDLDPAEDTGLFDLQIDEVTEQADAGDGDSTGPVTVSAGTSLDPGDTHTVGEVAGTNTSLADYDSSIQCVDRGTTNVVASGTGTGPLNVDVDPDDDIVCTISNLRKGKIIVEKSVNGNGETFAFTGDITPPACDIGDGGTCEKVVSAGQYTVTETVSAGYSLTDITCDDDDSSGDISTATATYNVEAGEIVKCTFTNTKQGVITVKKLTVPADDPQQFTFAGDVAGAIGHDGTLSTENLDPGTYTSTETVPDGWDLTDISCSDANSTGDTGTGVATFNLEAGESITCTFTNTKQGSITIEKVTDPTGDAQTFTFAGDVAGSLADGGTATESVAPGGYTSTETVPDGWALTDITCDDTDSSGDTGTATATFNVDAGEDVKCTFTNTKLGSITVEKQTDPDGDPQSFSFAGDAAGSIADDGTIVVSGLLPGAYTSTETVPDMWALTDISCDDGNSTGDTGTATATFNVEAGEDVKCTFTNTKGGMIKVVKQTNPDGAEGDFTFAGDLIGTIQDDGFIEKSVAPGQYSTTETVPAGFELTSILCDDTDSTGDTGTATATYNVAAGEMVTCTFTNTARGTIIVEKQTTPDADPTLFDFAGDAAGSIADGQQIVVSNLSPGQYTSTETVPTGWELTSIQCDDTDSTGDTGTATATFNVEAGETVKCVFNNAGKGTIIVAKETIPDGDLTSFTFAGDVAGSLADGGQLSSADIPAGQYTSTETVPAGWDLKSIQCDDGNSSGDTGTATATFNLEPGETVTCTFTNEALARISLQKLVDGLPSTVSWNFTLEGPGVMEDVTFTSSTTFNDAYLMLGSAYTVCEVGLPASWTANWTVDGVPVAPTPDAIDNSILCYDFMPTSPDDAGATFQFVVDNRTPPGGEPRTIGYWKNWNRCTGGGQARNADRNGGAAEGFWLLEDVLPLLLGEFNVTDCEGGVAILDKRSVDDGRKRANDGAYALAAQLLAAKANISPVVNAGCRPPDLNTWIADADALLTGLGFDATGSYLRPNQPGRADAMYLAGNLDDYNNGMYCAP